MSEQDYAKKMAFATLQDATSQIFNIPGDRFQMAYDVLEALISNLEIEIAQLK